jgi:hypothetical protein
LQNEEQQREDRDDPLLSAVRHVESV